MASSDSAEIPEKDVNERGLHKEEKDEDGKGGFIEKVKDFIHDIGEKIEEAIGFGKPSADVTGIHIPGINLHKADIVVDVLVKNPNPVPIPLIDIDYLIESDGRKLVSGLIPDAGTIKAHGSETVKIPVTLIYDDIKSTYNDIKPGSIIPYKIKVDLIVDVPVFGRITIPLEKNGEIPIPYKPDIDLEKIKFEKFSFEETVATLHLKLENKNDFDLGLNSLLLPPLKVATLACFSAAFSLCTTCCQTVASELKQMDAAAQYNPRTVDEVFKDFKARRAGMIRALTLDVDYFYQQCDPEKENLCLYGFPNGQWEVNLPAEEVPPELPEPALGINFARDGMNDKDWLALVAVHSDAWLLSVAFYFGSRFGFDKTDRKKLFNLINDVPTLFEVVTGTAKNPVKEKPSNSHHGSNKSKSSSKGQSESQTKSSKITTYKKEEEDEDLGEEEEEEDEHGDTLCGACGETYASDEFWICCDLCETWFHGKCVKITPARAEHIKQYKCPSCSNKRARP